MPSREDGVGAGVRGAGGAAGNRIPSILPGLRCRTAARELPEGPSVQRQSTNRDPRRCATRCSRSWSWTSGPRYISSWRGRRSPLTTSGRAGT